MATTPLTTAVQPIRWMSGINTAAGLWLFISPFVLDFAGIGTALWNSLIIGAVIFVLAIYRAANPLRHKEYSWFNAVLGFWLIISPFLLGYGSFGETSLFQSSAATWNGIIVGLVVLAFGAGSATATGATRTGAAL